MNTIQIPFNSSTESIQAIQPPPPGATHYRFTPEGLSPFIDKIRNLDAIAGYTGTLEYGTAAYEGRGRHAKIKTFASLEDAAPVQTEPMPPAVEPAPEPETDPAPDAAPAAEPTSKGRKNKVLGFSACAVAKALGKAGVKHAEAERIFRAHGIEMPKASLSVQLGFGRNPAAWERHGKPAELTEAQIAELRASAPTP